MTEQQVWKLILQTHEVHEGFVLIWFSRHEFKKTVLFQSLSFILSIDVCT